MTTQEPQTTAPAAAPNPSTDSPALVPSFLDQIDKIGVTPEPEPQSKAPEPVKEPTPTTPPAPTPPQAPEKDDDDLPRAKAQEEPKAPVQPSANPDAEPTTPKGLREALKSAKAELAKFTAEK